LYSQASLLVSDDSVAPSAVADYAPPIAAPRPDPDPAWQPARYGAQRRPNIGALLGSVVVVGALLSALLTVNVVKHRKAQQRLTVMALLQPPEPPPPPPPERRPDPVKEAVSPSPIVAPQPLVMLPPAPAQVATSPVPPPPAPTIAGPPSPAPRPAAPSIESAGDLSSRMISAIPPRYPTESRRKREQGVVLLSVLLAVDGTVADISIAQSSGFDRLDRAALSAVRRWRWSPTMRGGAPVMVRGVVEVPFVLQG